MSNKRTLKALEELVKTEHMAVAALDAAYEEVDDNKLRKNYRKWRDAHMKQANALNERLEDLGGDPVEYEVGSGKGQAKLWGKLTGGNDDTSLAGMRIGAERGLKRYIDHLDDIDDPKALNVIRKNLEAKQDEIDWYDEQVSKERGKDFDTKLESSRQKVKDYEVQSKDNKDSKGKKGGLPFPLLVVLGAIGAAAYFLLRRGDDSEYDDYGEDAFRYEGDDTSTDSGSSSGGYSSTGSMSAGGSGSTVDMGTDTAIGSTGGTGAATDYNPFTSHGSNGGGDQG